MKTLLTIVALFVLGTECAAERGYDIRITADVCTPFGCQTRSISCVAVPIRTKETDRQVWLTTAHCFKGYRRGTAQIVFAGTAHPAKVIFSQEGRHWDIAIVTTKTIAGLKPMTVFGGKGLRYGTRLTLYRRTLGYRATTGEMYRGPEGWLALKAPIRNGDSGGPIVNDSGELVGLMSRYPNHNPSVSWNTDFNDITWALRKVSIELPEKTAPKKMQPKPKPEPPKKADPVPVPKVEPKPSRIGEVAGVVAPKAAGYAMSNLQIAGIAAGGPAAIGAFLLARRLLRRRKRRSQVAPPAFRGDHETAIPEPAEDPTEIRYIQPTTDAGLARMRRAMSAVSGEYPAAGAWIRMIEDAYSLILSGEKSHVRK